MGFVVDGCSGVVGLVGVGATGVVASPFLAVTHSRQDVDALGRIIVLDTNIHVLAQVTELIVVVVGNGVAGVCRLWCHSYILPQ